MRRALASAMLVLACAAPLEAQRFEFVQPKADCNTSRVAYDNPFFNKGWHMQRWKWHVSYAALSLATAYVLHRSLGVSSERSAKIVSFGFGFGPHIGNNLLNVYPIDPLDWTFDALDRSTPLIALGVEKAGDFKTKALYILASAGGYVALRCYASP